MGVSRLFEAERIHIVTAVAWFYRGEAGGFRYWPEGVDGLDPARRHLEYGDRRRQRLHAA